MMRSATRPILGFVPASVRWSALAAVLVSAVAIAQPGHKHDHATQDHAKQDQAKPGVEAGVPGVLPPGFPGEHRLLAELTGNFNVTVQIHAEGKEPTEVKGVAVRKMGLNSRFLQETLDVTAAATPFTLETAIGFNPDGKDGERFELCRLSSAAFPMIVERGGFDSPTKVFTFKGEYLAEGKAAKTRTVLRLDAHHVHTLEVYVAYEDPATKKVLTPEFQAFTVEYQRVP